VSATNRPLERDVEQGRFRADLLARLGHTVAIPPLRERGEDVPRLVDHFLARYGRGAAAKTFSPEAMDVLRRHHWPFNVRELQQVVERAVCLVDGSVVRVEDLPEYLQGTSVAAVPAAEEGPPGPLRKAIEELERREIVRALEHTKGNKRRAMELLQLSPETFYRRLEDFGLHKKGE
jgi:DNA-binding NtrC family response regulator